MAKSTSISKLTPKSFNVIVDGKEVRIAADKFENAIMNMQMVAQVRGLFQDQMKKISEQDTLLTPREMKDIAETARSIIEVSGGVYDKSEPLDNNRPAEKSVKSDDVIDFGSLKPQPEPEKNDDPAGKANP